MTSVGSSRVVGPSAADTALLLDALTGWDAQIWLTLQAKWDLWHALRALTSAHSKTGRTCRSSAEDMHCFERIDRAVSIRCPSRGEAHLIDVLSAVGKSRGTGIVTAPVAAHSVPRCSRTM